MMAMTLSDALCQSRDGSLTDIHTDMRGSERLMPTRMPTKHHDANEYLHDAATQTNLGPANDRWLALDIKNRRRVVRKEKKKKAKYPLGPLQECGPDTDRLCTLQVRAGIFLLYFFCFWPLKECSARKHPICVSRRSREYYAASWGKNRPTFGRPA